MMGFPIPVGRLASRLTFPHFSSRHLVEILKHETKLGIRRKEERKGKYTGAWMKVGSTSYFSYCLVFI